MPLSSLMYTPRSAFVLSDQMLSHAASLEVMFCWHKESLSYIEVGYMSNHNNNRASSYHYWGYPKSTYYKDYVKGARTAGEEDSGPRPHRNAQGDSAPQGVDGAPGAPDRQAEYL